MLKICNNWKSFHNDIENIKSNLIKNAYLPFLIEKVIKKYLYYKCSSNQTQLKDKSDIHYFKLPYICNLSHHIKNKLLKLSKEFCEENFNIKLVFSSFKIKNYFSYKGPTPNNLKSFLVYKFTCASCKSSFIEKTCHHFKTRIEEHIKKDNKSNIFLNICTTPHHALTNSLCFKIIDKANSKFDLKIKEALHTNWRKPNLKCKTKSFSSHAFTIASVPPCFFLTFFSFIVFCNSLSSIVFIISMLIINTLYCLSNTFLLLHLFMTHLVRDFIILCT